MANKDRKEDALPETNDKAFTESRYPFCAFLHTLMLMQGGEEDADPVWRWNCHVYKKRGWPPKGEREKWYVKDIEQKGKEWKEEN